MDDSVAGKSAIGTVCEHAGIVISPSGTVADNKKTAIGARSDCAGAADGRPARQPGQDGELTELEQVRVLHAFTLSCTTLMHPPPARLACPFSLVLSFNLALL